MNMMQSRDLMDRMPDALEAESALLGALMMNNAAFSSLPATFAVEHFHEVIHAEIFRAMGEARSAGKKINPVTVRSYMAPEMSGKKIGDMTVSQYLASLVTNAVTIVNVPDYADAITGAYHRRQAIMIGEDAQTIAVRAQDELQFIDSIRDIRARLTAIITDIEARSEPQESFNDAIDGTLDRTADAMSGKALEGLDPGIPEVKALTGLWQPENLIIIGGDVKQGKGQPLDAKILTPFGYRRMGDMSVGSQITAPDGTVAKVLQIHKLGIRQLFDVRFSDGTSCEVTDDHLWLARRAQRTTKRAGAVVSGEQSLRKYTTTEMMDLMASNKSSRFHIPVTAPVPFTSGRAKDRPIHPYVLGVLLGDGCLTKATLEFCSADAEIVSRVEEKMGRKVTKSACCRSAPTYRLSGMPDIKAYLVRAKLHGKLSQDKHIPKQYLYSSIGDRYELARGLMDTDGWAGSSNADAAAFFGTSSKRLAEDAAWLFRSLGAVVSIHEKEKFYSHKGEKKQGLNSYTLRIRHPNARELFSLPRKQEKCAAPRYMTRSIVSITPGRKAESQCITVSHPSSLYLTNDFIVTHNSALAWQIAFNLAEKVPVAGNSGEMSRSQIIMREKARRTGVSAKRQKLGQVSESEIQALVKAGQEMKRLQFMDIDCHQLTLDQVDQRVERLVGERGIKAFVVDHILKLAWTGKMEDADDFKKANRATSTLKNIAMKRGVTMVALTHLNKTGYQEFSGRSQSYRDRLNAAIRRRPTYKNLLGNIDKDADHALIVFQPRPIIIGMEPEEGTEDHALWQHYMEQTKGKAEIILSLSRESEPSRREIQWNGATTSYGPAFNEQFNERGLF